MNSTNNTNTTDIDLEHLKNIKLQGFTIQTNTLLGKGSFGSIFLGESNENSLVAIKVENINSPLPQLAYEYKLLKFLNQDKPIGFPLTYDFQTINDYNFMVFEALGDDLSKLVGSLPNKTPSRKCLLLIAEQMLRRIENLHKKGIIHRDIKPENFLIGREKKNKHIIYLIDFGFSRKYIVNNNHIEYLNDKDFVGTARFASINTHKGIEQSRRDDLESLFYILYYFSNGCKLPWDGIQKNTKEEKYLTIQQRKSELCDRIMNININKKSHTENNIANDLISDYVELLNYIKSLNFYDEPDYEYMKEVLNSISLKYSISFNYEYDWDLNVESKLKSEVKIVFGINRFIKS